MSSEIPSNQPGPNFNPTPSIEENLGHDYIIIADVNIPEDTCTSKADRIVQQELKKHTPRMPSRTIDDTIKSFLQEKAISFYIKKDALTGNLGKELKSRIDALQPPVSFVTKALRGITSLFSPKTLKDSLSDLISRVAALANDSVALSTITDKIKASAAANQKETKTITLEGITAIAQRILGELKPIPSTQKSNTNPLQGRMSSSTPHSAQRISFPKNEPPSTS